MKKFDKVVLIGEVKTPQNNELHMAKVYCEYGCTNPTCKSERHKQASVVRRLYNYMVVNGLFFGLFSSHKHWAGFIRDCEGNKLAKTGTLPDCIGKYTSLVKCNSPDCKHNRLPKECSVWDEKNSYDTKKRNIDEKSNQMFVGSA